MGSVGWWLFCTLLLLWLSHALCTLLLLDDLLLLLLLLLCLCQSGLLLMHTRPQTSDVAGL